MNFLPGPGIPVFSRRQFTEIPEYNSCFYNHDVIPVIINSPYQQLTGMASTPKMKKPRYSWIRVGILRYLIQHDVGSTPDMLESLDYDRDKSGNISDPLLQLESEGLIAQTECPPVETGSGRRPICYKIPREFEILVRIYDKYSELQSDFQNAEWIQNKILTERLSFREGGIREIVRQMLRLSPEFFSRCLRDPEIDKHIFRHRILFLDYQPYSSATFLSLIEDGVFTNPINRDVYWYCPFFGVCLLQDEMEGVSNEEGMKLYEEHKHQGPDTSVPVMMATLENICWLLFQIEINSQNNDEVANKIRQLCIECLDYTRLITEFQSTKNVTLVPAILKHFSQLLAWMNRFDESFHRWIYLAQDYDWTRLNEKLHQRD